MKLKYLISPDVSLTTAYISNRIRDFQTRHLPGLNRLWNYYIGKQQILKKKQTSIVNKPCNTSVTNFCESIVKNYNGYITGIPISYSNDDLQEVIDIINYNDVTQEDTEYLKNALIYGRAFEVNYIDENGKQRFKLFNTKECIPIYSNTVNGELLYVVRFYQESLVTKELEDNYIVEVYGPSNVQIYRSSMGFASYELIDEYQHFYGQCPVTVFSLNEDEEGIFAQIIPLQDDYNTIKASQIDEQQTWADSFMVFHGVRALTDDILAMKSDKVLMLPQPDQKVEYLEKNPHNDQSEDLLTRTENDIYTIAACPNFNDEKFLTRSGESLKYKLVGFENIATGIENYMRKALQRRIENIVEVLHIVSEVRSEEVWRDIDIRFTRNLPNSLQPTTVSELMQYKGLVSSRTLLEMVPFIKDPDEELKRVKEEQQEEIDLYEYGHKEADFANR